uniref:Uncharacterized non-globular protein n=1 Tax=uncultured crenarchaeote 4B7 TaxID=44557 RepID=Q977R6_9ARCH|nr:uncharacterized non-globular protein [uncultured crenarchaeote 4B7]
MKYLDIRLRSANLNKSISVIDRKIPVTAITPAFNPNISISNKNADSGVSGIINSVNSTFDGSANFEIFPAALIEKSIKRIMEIAFAYFFNFGNFFRIPRARIAPCKRPIANTTANV